MDKGNLTILTKCKLVYEDWTKNVTFFIFDIVFYLKCPSFNLCQDSIGTNVPTKFHEDWLINVANKAKTATPPRGLFHKDSRIIVTFRVLTRKTATSPDFNKDWTISVASRVFTRTDKMQSEKLTMRTLCSVDWSHMQSMMMLGIYAV
ncbi:hypothetical protein DPMN_146067 [Dreissena polymorpha]|uniref:Uncharacterized protein n=1 Tax=Dreissena polymorpha TaxID=45954 RepID=A0A9D4F788_DREPO|nr:hypothetical protein DPMN_146067 [Dreissena polymorpha]